MWEGARGERVQDVVSVHDFVFGLDELWILEFWMKEAKRCLWLMKWQRQDISRNAERKQERGKGKRNSSTRTIELQKGSSGNAWNTMRWQTGEELVASMVGARSARAATLLCV